MAGIGFLHAVGGKQTDGVNGFLKVAHLQVMIFSFEWLGCLESLNDI
jgi:hypothetical protein